MNKGKETVCVNGESAVIKPVNRDHNPQLPHAAIASFNGIDYQGFGITRIKAMVNLQIGICGQCPRKNCKH